MFYEGCQVKGTNLFFISCAFVNMKKKILLPDHTKLNAQLDKVLPDISSWARQDSAWYAKLSTQLDKLLPD